MHLRRALGDRVFYWRPDKGQEIDAVVQLPNRLPVYAEVKYRSRVSEDDLVEMARVGGGLVLGVEQNRWWRNQSIYEIPVPELLACLDAPALTTRQG